MNEPLATNVHEIPRVSVIVPVCNVEAFLEQCLESIAAQTFRNIEIICLNDGSTDASLEILQGFAARDERFVVVDKPNEGYGATCNRGLGMARGEYVAIVEPDDYLDARMFEHLLAFADSFGAGAVDVVKESWFDVADWNTPSTTRVRPGYLCKRLPNSRKPQTIEQLPELLAGHPSIWSALYRRSYLREQGICFVEYPGAGWADNPFLIDSLCRGARIVYSDSAHYYYRNELSEKKYAPASEAALLMPIERWCEMTRRIADASVECKAVWRAHYQRGFNYVDDVLAHEGECPQRVWEAIRAMFAIMDACMVYEHPRLSPVRKRFFAELRAKVGEGAVAAPAVPAAAAAVVPDALVAAPAADVPVAASAPDAPTPDTPAVPAPAPVLDASTPETPTRFSPVPYWGHLAREACIRLRAEGLSATFSAVLAVLRR